MRFFSKCSTYTLVKRPGTTVVHINGIPQTVPGEYIRFEDGAYSTDNEEDIKFLMSNPAFGKDYVADTDSFKGTRRSLEPEHNIEMIQFGHAVGNLNPKKSPDQVFKEQVAEEAKRIAMAMLPDLVKQVLSSAQKAPESVKPAAELSIQPAPEAVPEAPKRGPGRPKKAVKVPEAAQPAPEAAEPIEEGAASQ